MVGVGRPMGLAPRLLGAQAAPGRRVGPACLGSRPAWLGFGSRTLALKASSVRVPSFGALRAAWRAKQEGHRK